MVLGKLHRVSQEVLRPEWHIAVNDVAERFAVDRLDMLATEPVGIAPPQERALNHQFTMQRYAHYLLAWTAPDPFRYGRIDPVAPFDDRLTLIHQGLNRGRREEHQIRIPGDNQLGVTD